MNTRQFESSRWLLILLVGFLAIGCSGGMIKAKGRVVKNGEPFVPGANQMLIVTFIPEGQGGEKAEDAYPANVNRQDGSFEVLGKSRNGIPPGKYRVAVRLMRGDNDLLKGAYVADKTPFVFEVKSSEEIVLDVK